MDSEPNLTASKPALGFWLYLMSDSLVFATLFATFAVLKDHTAHGPGASELFSLPFVLTETIILLTSSFACGLSAIASSQQQVKRVKGWLALTLLLGVSFLAMELSEFSHLITEGQTPRQSAFLSAFFTLVGTHGVHISIGIIWAGVMLLVMQKKGLSSNTQKKLQLFSMYWHFLDVIWIFIFTFVYLLGAVK